MGERHLRVQDVHFCYDGPKVLRGVCFSIPPASFVSLIGPNGSGKSTLFRLACGDREASSGGVFYGDADVYRMRARERARLFSVLQQGERRNFPFTVLEMVLFGLHPQGYAFDPPTAKQRAHVRDVMMQVGVWNLSSALVTQISGGEAQRVMLARALVQRPQILFLDESMNELDIRAKIELTQYLKRLTREQGMIVFAINHDLTAAARHSDRIIALHQGRVVADGSPPEVFNASFFQTVFGVTAQILPEGEFLIRDAVLRPPP